MINRQCTVNRKRIASLLVCIFLPAVLLAGQRRDTLRNDLYTLRNDLYTLRNDLYTIIVEKDGSLLIRNRDGSSEHFLPRFTILFRTDDPALKEYYEQSLNSVLPDWNADGQAGRTADYYSTAQKTVLIATSFHWQPHPEASTPASSSAPTPASASTPAPTLAWTFPSSAAFDLQATLTLPPGKSLPRIEFTLTPKKQGWYSVGYTGAPASSPDSLSGLWQPLIWQERRFPDRPYLSMEHMCTLPATLVENAGAPEVTTTRVITPTTTTPANTTRNARAITTSVIADPAEIPFRMPTFDNARFGVLVRNDNGAAQSQLFAPVMGSASSHLEPNRPFRFAIRLLVQKGDWLTTYRYIAATLFRFHDYRQNATASLNETIDNMVDFAMNDTYSGWDKDLKAFDYSTDVRNTVKLVSALHPLSLALIRDNPEIYHRRALPMIEYLMSREKFLFTLNEGEKSQNPSHLLRGPAADVSELGALYSISRERSPVFRHYAVESYGRPRTINLSIVRPAYSWQGALALYRITSEQHFLDSAIAGALQYIRRRIDTPQRDFADAHLGARDGGQFWTDFSPKWFDLLELYEQTHDRRFLDAAHYAAEIYTTYVWMQPMVPDSAVLINPTGRLPMGDPWSKTDPRPMEAPPLRVPAWRVAQVGLTPEASNTYDVNPAVLLTTYAAFMLRLAWYTGDSFLAAIARSAVVGRYTNYPGYDINLEYTTVYQRPDYPLRDWNDLTYNQIYYNHVWPHIALLTDYLITDALFKSKGRISFPSQYAEGYAYLHTKVYGDRPGEFYGDSNVWLWMPAGLLRTDNIQINYVAARGNGNLYISLLNQSFQPQHVRLRLNPDVVPIDWGKTYPVTVWEGDKPATTQRHPATAQGRSMTTQSHPATATSLSIKHAFLRSGELDLSVPAAGITSIRIRGVPVRTRFQQQVYDSTARPLGAGSYGEWPATIGKVTGMLIDMGRSLTSGYIWLSATEKELQSATLHYRSGNRPGDKPGANTADKSRATTIGETVGEWRVQTDAAYPFEFSIPLRDQDQVLEFWLEGRDTTGKEIRTDTMRLMK
jgi:hypothetical protein